MFFDGIDIYLASSVLAATTQSKFSTLDQNIQFISLTLVGMTIGGLVTGFLGDRFGRRFTYQFNLLVFGLASLAAAFAQDMNQLIACRFVQGIGFGAEIVVGYSTLTEFVPPKTRGRWLAFHVVPGRRGLSGDRAARLPGDPDFRLAADVRRCWRRRARRLVPAQAPARVPALARSEGPGGRGRSADACDRERKWPRARHSRHTAAPATTAPATAMALLRPPLLQRMVVGSWVLITINTLVFTFVIFLPQFFLRQGLTISQSLGYTVALATGFAGRLRAGRIRRRTRSGGVRASSAPRSCTIVTGWVYCPVQRRVRSGDRARRRLRADGRDLRAARHPDRGLHARAVPRPTIRLRANGICHYAGPPGGGGLAVHRGRADGELQPSGVIGLMTGLLVVQIAVVWAWGIEPAKRRLEEIEPAATAV
jgi:putative MFS transporter